MSVKARRMVDTDVTLRFLRQHPGSPRAGWFQLTAQEIPSQTRLLANYPNPFNPETWIPYQLAQAGEVRIVIYDLKGEQIRALELGFKAAAYYTAPSQAAYWDGRNRWGEWVSSGIYFYQLQTGDYQQTRRLIILK